MAVRLFTNKATALLAAIKAGIDNGRVRHLSRLSKGGIPRPCTSGDFGRRPTVMPYNVPR